MRHMAYIYNMWFLLVVYIICQTTYAVMQYGVCNIYIHIISNIYIYIHIIYNIYIYYTIYIYIEYRDMHMYKHIWTRWTLQYKIHVDLTHNISRITYRCCFNVQSIRHTEDSMFKNMVVSPVERPRSCKMQDICIPCPLHLQCVCM